MQQFETYRQVVADLKPIGISGRVSGLRGLTISVSDFPAPMGAGCRIQTGHSRVDGRVIGFAGDQTLVMPIGQTAGICRGDKVVKTSSRQRVPLGRGMLGRVLDGFARPLDGRGPFKVDARRPIWPTPTPAMQRPPIDRPLATGIRAIDSMLTIGRGQRMGVLAGSGLGKSVLLGMISRFTNADATVIALIGERGREVRDFIEKDLGPEGLARSVVIVSTGDEPPLVRVQAAATATAVAEYLRDQGLDVLLLMDSLTRLATAQRQIGLAAGEPPATRGYPPSVFNLLPELLERSGRTEAGSITGFYSVLVEGDDLADPVCEAVRSITDGHVFLSRQLASMGHYPAVDVLQSISRVMIDVTSPAHQAAAREVRRMIALYAEIEDMVKIGAYRRGASADYDLAMRMLPEIRQLLAQPIGEQADFHETAEALIKLHQTIQREAQEVTDGQSGDAQANREGDANGQ